MIFEKELLMIFKEISFQNTLNRKKAMRHCVTDLDFSSQKINLHLKNVYLKVLYPGFEPRLSPPQREILSTVRLQRENSRGWF